MFVLSQSIKITKQINSIEEKISITPSTYTWINRYGKVNENNSWIPRDFWLEDCEKEAIIDFAKDHTGNGYRRYIVHWEISRNKNNLLIGIKKGAKVEIYRRLLVEGGL